MFIITKKIRRARLAACTLLLALTVLAAGAGTLLAQEIQSAVAPAITQPDPTGIRSNQDRVDYLEALGWIVADEAAAVEDVLIPAMLDESYADYLAVQEEMGFDLTQYTGKTVKRYTYQVKNFPGLQENIWASLLVYKKKVIGGEIFCAVGDGFTQSLRYPIPTE